jgi:hypothetical protein
VKLEETLTRQNDYLDAAKLVVGLSKCVEYSRNPTHKNMYMMILPVLTHIIIQSLFYKTNRPQLVKGIHEYMANHFSTTKYFRTYGKVPTDVNGIVTNSLFF